MSGTGPGTPPTEDEGFVLLEGWMFGAMMFPPAMELVLRLPPANDNTAD